MPLRKHIKSLRYIKNLAAQAARNEVDRILKGDPEHTEEELEAVAETWGRAYEELPEQSGLDVDDVHEYTIDDMNDDLNDDLNDDMNDKYSAGADPAKGNSAVDEINEGIMVQVNDSSSSENEISDFNSESDVDEKDSELANSLQAWCVKYHVQGIAMDALLSILRPINPSLPKDHRTLLKSPRVTSLKNLENGQYSHIGLKKGILKCMHAGIRDVQSILIDIFCDGVKLQNVSSECWPLLGRCANFLNNKPFVIGLFYGNGKPMPIDDYLADYVSEMKELKSKGLFFNGCTFTVDVRFYLADAPARAYLKGTKGHTASSGCERCEQEGIYIDFMIFSTEIGPLRTDESFDEKRDFEYHKYDSPLKELNTKFISQFVLDPMHLLDYGVTKRFLEFVLNRGPPNVRMSGRQIELFGELLESLSQFVPCEFSRKPTLQRIGKWKSSEYRLLLLYLGPLVFRYVLKENVYKLFLLLHCSAFIMNSQTLIETYLNICKEFVQMFVNYSATVFGEGFVVYNVHNILHLPSDVEKFGTLQSFSAYVFEDCLGKLKKLVKSCSKPLQQICKRLAEKDMLNSDVNLEKQSRGLLYEHNDGPTADENFVMQYDRVELQSCTLTRKEPNNCVCLVDGSFAWVQNILRCEGDEIKIVSKKLERAEDLYIYPLPSSELGVCVISQLSSSLSVNRVSDVMYKCFCMPYDDTKFVAVPLLHLI